ncbi:hypothetical protein TWF730_001654 [Orbilia blumenaviensis]|uniref:Uncharacterized protein n=1 Tax=Orbilia blumenaviensis TaxID=1796055 RepID=A0AAV9UJK3_9PEZI
MTSPRHSISSSAASIRLRYLIYGWLYLASFATVRGQGDENKFPSAGARRQTLPVGYGPHILASNQDWIQDEAGLALAALHNKQEEAGLYDPDRQQVVWPREGELIVVPVEKVRQLANDLHLGDPNKQNRDPLYNLLILGKRVVQMQSNIFRMLTLLKRAIPRMGITTARQPLFDVLDVVYSVIVARLQNRFIGNPSLEKLARKILVRNSLDVQAALAAVDGKLRPYLERLIDYAISHWGALDVKDRIELERPGMLDNRGVLNVSGVRITRNGAYESTFISLDSERLALRDIFDMDMEESKQGLIVYLSDALFLISWETVYFTSLRGHYFTTLLSLIISHQTGSYAEFSSKPEGPAKKMEITGPGIFNRGLIGYERYIKDKYGRNLVEFASDDPKWLLWTQSSDRKYFIDLLAHLSAEVNGVVNAALPVMLDCFADISLQVHRSGLPSASKLGPVPEFAIPKTSILDLSIDFLRNYPEFYSKGNISEYRVGPARD